MENGESGAFWKNQHERFLRQVWPLQKAVRTPAISTLLIDLAFSDEDSFVAISDAILLRISKLQRGCILPPSIRGDEGKIVAKHPKRVLDILYAALAENANDWPYEISDIALERIIGADPSLRSDTKWVELMRRWNSR